VVVYTVEVVYPAGAEVWTG
jgi:hypothetical protein